MTATPVHVAYSSNIYVNGLLGNAWRWADEGGSIDIVYYLAHVEDHLGRPTGTWGTAERAVYAAAANSWAAVANLTLTETTAAGEANFSEWIMDEEQMTASFGGYGSGYHGFPEWAVSQGFVYGAYGYELDPGVFWTADDLAPGSLFGTVFIHELGHGLGLKHPFDLYGDAPLFPGIETEDGTDKGDNNLGFQLYTVMAYEDAYSFNAAGRIVIGDGDSSLDIGRPVTPMALDIAAIQYLYGINPTTNAGNNVYVLPNANDPGIAVWKCIWDTGGNDELKYTGTRNAIIDLTAATLDNSPTGGGVLSYAAFIYGGFTIANGVVVEKATGGSGNDLLTGNASANVLTGNAGKDILTGGRGKDTLTGGNGRDTFDFNAVNESAKTAARDTISDFSHAQHDKIDLSTIDADNRGAASGNQAFVFIGDDSFADYHAAHLEVFGMIRFAGGILQGNVNGNLGADFSISINAASPVAGDFIL